MDIVFGFADWVIVVCELGYVGLCERITLRLHVRRYTCRFIRV